MGDTEKELREKEKALADREKALAAQEEENKKVKEALAQKEAQLAELLPIDPFEEERELTKDEKKLVAEACEAYGIAEKYVMKARVGKNIDGEEMAVVCTVGGAKVKYRKGDRVTPLSAVRINGIIPKKMKPVTVGKTK